MIWFYSGTNGSGKSLHVAKDIYRRLCRRGHNRVIATFDINIEAIKRFRGDFQQVDIYKLNPAMLTRYALENHVLDGRPDQVEGQTLLVIDEAQRIFNPRDYDKNGRREWLDWLPEHRKYGFNIILISPYDKMIDKQIRALFEYEVVHRKANNFGFIGVLLSLFRLPLFFAITYWYGIKVKCGVEQFVCARKYTRIYNTFQRFGAQGDPLSAVARGGAASPVGGPATTTADSGAQEREALVCRLVAVLTVMQNSAPAPAAASGPVIHRRSFSWPWKR